MTRRRAFTLLETLAAVTLLAGLAAVAVPLALRLGGGQITVADRMRALELLRNLPPGEAVGTLPLKQRAGWFVRCTPLTAGPRPGPTAGIVPAAHRWVHLAIVDGPDTTAMVLADGIALVSDASGAAP